MLDMTLHEKLKRLCGERRWGQTDLIDAVGDISKSTMNNWFNGRTVPDLGSALRIAKALDVPLDWLADDGASYPPPRPEATPEETATLKLIRALQLDEEEALRRLATPAGTGDPWLPGSVRTFEDKPRRAAAHANDAAQGRANHDPDTGREIGPKPRPKRKEG